MRLIDADELKLKIVEEGQQSKRYKVGDFWELNRDEIWRAIDDLPTIERKTGNWIIDDDWNMCDIEGTLIGTKEFECDQCGYRELVFDGTVTHLNFCPNCGADMRGET